MVRSRSRTVRRCRGLHDDRPVSLTQRLGRLQIIELGVCLIIRGYGSYFKNSTCFFSLYSFTPIAISVSCLIRVTLRVYSTCITLSHQWLIPMPVSCPHHLIGACHATLGHSFVGSVSIQVGNVCWHSFDSYILSCLLIYILNQ